MLQVVGSEGVTINLAQAEVEKVPDYHLFDSICMKKRLDLNKMHLSMQWGLIRLDYCRQVNIADNRTNSVWTATTGNL
jgi:hypothetical protein